MSYIIITDKTDLRIWLKPWEQMDLLTLLLN